MMKTRCFLLAAGASLALAFTFSCSSDDGEAASFIDERNGKEYKTTVIGTQTWMAENLNYDAEGSKCYGEDGIVYGLTNDDYTLSEIEIQANCLKYGRLYGWSTAMALSSDLGCDSIRCSDQIDYPHQGICPDGWHIPSNSEWEELSRYVDNRNNGHGLKDQYDGYYKSQTAGKYLKTKSGWDEGRNGTDKYGFSALPGGLYSSSGAIFMEVGNQGSWWSINEYGEYNRVYAYQYYIYGNYFSPNREFKGYLLSVRCIKDL
jgi:uncharacterized protein (TIGR02145 family)